MVDLHNDALLKLTPENLLTYLRQAKLDGCDEIWLSVWTTELNDPLSVISAKKALLDSIANDPQYPICRLHIEDSWFITPDNLNQLITLNPHSIGLTWNNANKIAGGAHSHQGITAFGYQVIKQLEAAKIQIDTAHLNRRSFWQFTRVTTRPIVCTHTAFNAVRQHPRNLTNRQIKAIIQSGGQIGLALVPKFLTKHTTSCGIYDIIKHIFYFKTHFKATLNWGTDFYGTDQLPVHITNYHHLTHLMHAQIIGQSVLHQPIIAFQLGSLTAPHRLFITAGMHAREWISSLALQTWLQNNPTIPADTSITAVICCNPDGVRLVTQGVKNLSKHYQKFLTRINHNNPNFNLWKANIRGVDLNVNFDAGWGHGRNNLTIIAPANYIGPEPHSEPENRALLRLIRQVRPTRTIALHTKGQIIYYSRLEDQLTADHLARITKFTSKLSTNSYGGLTDYLALRCQIPSFTVELGSDNLPHPIGKEHLPTIMDELNPILNYFLTGE